MLSGWLLIATTMVVRASGVLQKIMERQHYAYAMSASSQAMGIAALRYYSQEPSLSALTVGFTSSPSAADRLPQLGNGGRAWEVEATAFHRIGEADCVWGEAGYTNGRRYDVRWNETSDFLLVYPYVMADGRGGNLNYEQYTLHGGYARAWHRLLYGFALGYRALSEYRQRDPRPNNTVADLEGSLSVGYFWHTYAAALAVEASKYKQTNDLVYFNDLGAQMEYHLTGIGNDFARFSGNNNSTFFKGHRIGARIGMTPRTALGLTASARYEHLHIDKVMSNLNRLVLNEIGEDTWTGEASWQQRRWGASVRGTYADRRGTDNLYGDAVSNIYPKIGSLDNYESQRYEVMLTGYYEMPLNEHLQVGARPSTGMSGFESTHASSGNRLDTHQWHYGLTAYGDWHNRKDRVVLNAAINGRQETDGRLTLNEMSSPELGEALNGIHTYLHKGETRLGLGLEYDHAINATWGITLRGGWEHATYGEGCHANNYKVGVGIRM